MEILTSMLYKNNRCNEEIADSISTGKLQFFDCPPILYSPTYSSEITNNQTNKSHSQGPNQSNKKPSLWSVLAHFKPKQIEQLKQLKKNLNHNELKQKNVLSAFTFGRKISHTEVEKPDYQMQFQPFRNKNRDL